jgi:uncharacterized MAPEG superfamily protein
MTLAEACVLAAAVLPYVLAGAAKSARVDNHQPRAGMEKVGGWQRRAYWAHQNAFEAFAPFAAGVILAQMHSVAQGRVDAIALTFVAARLLHGICYIGNWATARSISWALGIACVIALFLQLL